MFIYACPAREEALALLKKYNTEPFHIQHAMTVEGVMRWYANELGYGADADFWATVGLLHDVDFEKWPEQHCVKAPELLQEIEKVDGIERIRFMTSHPKDLSDELIDVIAANEKICRHIHLPMQSGSSRILNQMNRRYTKESYLELVDKIRRRIPEISLTTDIIVGFPGETEEDFLETMDVVNRVRFDTAFTFIYSKRTGTPAATFEDHATKEEIQNRFDRLIKRVSEISGEEICRYKGQVMPVLIESVSEQNQALLTGRLSNNILVHFKGDPSMIGEIRDVSLDECKGFYYMGNLV